MRRFYLGVHRAGWLAKIDVSLFVSHRVLRDRRSMPKALAPWALDSGGFTELSTYGKWQTGVDEYVEAVERYETEIGNLDFAAPQDWMCEPWIVEKTGLSVEEHQERTVENYLALKDAGPFIPVLQGWTLSDYERCVDLYAQAGVDLSIEPLVGLGSVCRREDTRNAEHLVVEFATRRLNLHGFGIKTTGLKRFGYLLDSADSMAWSYGGRMRQGDLHEGCEKKSCANCPEYALAWRRRVLRSLDYQQTHLAASGLLGKERGDASL